MSNSPELKLWFNFNSKAICIPIMFLVPCKEYLVLLRQAHLHVLGSHLLQENLDCRD